jgi:hypothetical protein
MNMLPESMQRSGIRERVPARDALAINFIDKTPPEGRKQDLKALF